MTLVFVPAAAMLFVYAERLVVFVSNQDFAAASDSASNPLFCSTIFGRGICLRSSAHSFERAEEAPGHLPAGKP